MADEGWREGAEQIPGILNETPDAVTEEEFWSAQDAAEYWTVPVRGALASRLSRLASRPDASRSRSRVSALPQLTH